MDINYTVFVKIDSRRCIIDINSSVFLTDFAEWIEIAKGEGDKYAHAQGNYFPQPIYTDEGIPRYKLEDGAPVERTADEIAADIAALPQPESTSPVTWAALAAAYSEGVNEA